MEPTEQVFLLNKLVEKNRHFENLNANPDFIKWREESVVPYLDSMRSAILGVDRTQPDWRERVAEAIVAYQETTKVYEKLFVLSVKTGEQARAELQKLAEVQGQS